MRTNMFLSPGVRLMRRLPFAAKFGLIAVVSGLPLLAVLWHLHTPESVTKQSKNANLPI